MDLLDPEPRDGFRRNLLIVLAVHAALIGAAWLFNRLPRETPKEQITWLDGSALGGAPSAEPALPEIEEFPAISAEPPPEPAPEPPPAEETKSSEADSIPPVPEPKAAEPAEKITPPQPAPTPKPVAKSTPAPKPVAKSAAKKKKATPKTVAKSKPKPEPTSAPSPAAAIASTPANKPRPAVSVASGASGGNQSGAANGAANGAPNGSASAAELQRYYDAVADEFRACWKVYKPVVAESTGARLTAIVHVRISSSGSMLGATLTRSTGNQEVDASIQKAFADFKQVPSPPAVLLNAGVFESNMAVHLSI